jgi:hypothetical protein
MADYCFGNNFPVTAQRLVEYLFLAFLARLLSVLRSCRFVVLFFLVEPERRTVLRYHFNVNIMSPIRKQTSKATHLIMAFMRRRISLR